jgi:5-methyltetrahydrofolate--homocysteine methyltransferase
MVFVAKEMKKAGLNIPLLIGGATTSRMHTAVKIAPHFWTTEHPVVHVLDASRAVTVVQSLLDESAARDEYVEEIADLYEEIREEHFATLEDRTILPLEAARARALKVDWAVRVPPMVPATLGAVVVEDQDLAELVPFIDWNPFFSVWEIRGKYPNRGYPRVFNDPDVGEEARKLFDEAQAMLAEIIREKWLQARGVLGIFPANSDGDDILIYESEEARAARAVRCRFAGLRQQAQKDTDEPHLCMSDFVAPIDSGVNDFLGAFAVSVFGERPHLERFEREHDDYKKIMLQALADRLAEAFAEHLHRRMRTSIWGYAADEALDAEDLIKVKYDGIRPAPGYPSQPDHTEKRVLWDLLQVHERTGAELTDSLAMLPASSVSALVFANKESEYFAVGKVARDQVQDYAARKGMPLEDAERWLAPILAYEPRPGAAGASL